MMSSQWSSTTKRIVVVGVVILALAAGYLLRTLIPPVLLALVLAYLLKPLVDRLELRARMPRMGAALLVFLGLLVLLSLIPIFLVPWLVQQVGLLLGQLQGLVSDIGAFLARPIAILGFEFQLEDLVGNVPQALQRLIQPFATGTMGFVLGLASSLLWGAVILVIAFYLVRDAERFRQLLDRLTPEAYAREMRRLREEVGAIWSQFFRGQLVLGLIIGLAVWIAMSAVGLPNAGLMGLIAGLLEVIPNFGPVLSAIPAAITAILRGSIYLPLSNFWFMILVLAIYALIQWAENAYVVPRIMGRRLQLHPVVVFIGVLAGGLLFGAVGVLLAAPIISTLRILLRYTYAKLLDQDPFPAGVRVARGEFYPGEIDAILFDLDGTLIETDDEAVEALAQRLTPLRRLIPGRDPQRAARRLVTAFTGPTTRVLGLLDRMRLDDEVLGAADRLYRWRGIRSIRASRPVDGVGETLLDLSRRYKMAIVTTRSRREAEAFLTQQNLRDLIEVITGREDTWYIKPHPAPILSAAKRLGVAVERCLVVGDTTADMQAARAAGARAVGVLCGFGSREGLEKAGADLILETTSELGQLF